MGISHLNTETFVAFCDISGFKEMMKNEVAALKALDSFYSSSYQILNNQNQNFNRIESLLVSDSGVFFVRPNGCNEIELLNSLLLTIKELNRILIGKNIMLTTSIAFGKFSYREKIEFRGIEKNQIYGNAYVKAFLDNENKKPKLKAGQCRIVKENLPDDCIEYLSTQNPKVKNKSNHFYYYWMVESAEEIEDFEEEYNNAYKRKFAGYLQALQKTWV